MAEQSHEKSEPKNDHEAVSSGLVPLIHQAAGHDGALTLADGSLFIKPTTQQEVDFYTQTQAYDAQPRTSSNGAESDRDMDLPGSKLIDWIPICIGTLTHGASSVAKASANDPLIIQKSSSTIDTGNTTTATETEDKANENEKEYIVLQNLYHGFKYPSILDIKLGSKLTDDEVTAPEKIARLQKVSDSTTSGSLNFRICGMKLYIGDSSDKPEFELYPEMNSNSVYVISDEKGDNYLAFNKFFGRSLNKDNAKDGILLFFTQHLGKIETYGNKMVLRLLEVTSKRLQILYNCLLDYEVRIYSGSLLFIYENDLTRWGVSNRINEEDNIFNNDELYEAVDPLIREPVVEVDSDEEDEDEDEGTDSPGSKLTPLSSLNVIDFAHAKYVSGKGYDENIIKGIENLIDIFDSLIKEISSKIED